jgi:RNA polymerase sigma-70 factor (ECF subfamily)
VPGWCYRGVGMCRGETTALLRSAKDGSDEALNRLLERCAGKLLALIRLRLDRDLRARLESRDILNASLMKAFQSLESFESSDAASLMGWLARIAENEIRDQREFHGRQRRDLARDVRIDERIDGLAGRVRSQTSRLVLGENLQRLEQALEALEPLQREVLLLRKLEELSFAEIAGRMNRSPDACRMLLARAMTALTLEMRGLA